MLDIFLAQTDRREAGTGLLPLAAVVMGLSFAPVWLAGVQVGLKLAL